MAEAPVPVQLALEALKILEAEDATLAEESRRKLPGFALRLAAAGEEVTVEKLLASARAREIERVAAPRQKQKTYDEIIAQFPKEAVEKRHRYEPERFETLDEFKKAARKKYFSFTHELYVAASAGQLDIVKYLIEERGIDIHDRSFVGEEVLAAAARKGHLDVVEYLVDACSADVNDARENPLGQAASLGHLHVVKFLKGRGADVHMYHERALTDAAAHGHMDVVKYLVEECGANINERDQFNEGPMQRAAEHGHLDVVKYIAENYRPDTYTLGHALREAAAGGHLDIVKYLVKERGVDVHFKNEAALNGAVICHPDITKYLVDECGADPRALTEDTRYVAIWSGKYDTVKYLAGKGADFSIIPHTLQDRMATYLAACTVWQKTVHADPRPELADKDPHFFRPVLYKAILDMLKKERAEIEGMAFNAAGLFGTEDRVLQYLEKWGKGGRQPLHDLIHMIKLPEKKTPEMDLKAWGDAVLKCGPSMANLVKFADRLPVPAMSDDGKTWSMKNTREKVAEFVYGRAKENLALAALCAEHSVDERDFNKALKIAKNPPAMKALPKITIEGSQFDMPGATFHLLAANDVRGLFLGEMTDCCQSIGGAGQSCAAHGFTSPFSGFYVVENAKGRIIGQTWAWYGEKGEVVFDSLETLGDNVKPKQWLKLTKSFAQALARGEGKAGLNISAFHVGTGGATPGSLRNSFNEATSPAQPYGYKGYRDSRYQVVIWQKKAGMKHG